MKLVLTFCALLSCATFARAQKFLNPRATQELPVAAPQGNALGDFKSGPKTTLSLRGEALSVASTGTDPIIYSSVLPPMRGPYFVEFRLNSNAP